jgi:plastocyanin
MFGTEASRRALPGHRRPTPSIINLLARTLRAAALPLLACALAPRADAQQGGGGRVEGKVVIGPALSARRPRFRIYSDIGQTSVPPREKHDAGSAMSDVVVYLEGAPRDAKPIGVHPPPTLTQRDERFVPHVLPVLVGTTVEFPNADPVYHNVFSLASAATFDLGRYPAGASKSVTFDQPGVVQVFCHIHSDMSAVILVLDTPLYTIPGADGRYALDGVPPGDYILVAWHERAAPIRRRIHVAAGATTPADVSIPIAEDIHDR